MPGLEPLLLPRSGLPLQTVTSRARETLPTVYPERSEHEQRLVKLGIAIPTAGFPATVAAYAWAREVLDAQE